MSFALRQPQPGARERTALTWAGCGLTILAGVALATRSPLSGVALPLVAVALAVPLWLATSARTGRALAVIVLYLGLVDGLVKMQTTSQLPTLLRDVLLYAVLAGMAYRARGPLRIPALGGWVLAWTVLILAQLASPDNGTPLHSVVSVRQHLEFVPLFFVAFGVLRTQGSLHAFLALLLTIAAINGVVGAYQSTLTPAQLAGWGPGYAQLLTGKAPRLAEGPDGKPRIRPPGLGSDMGFAGILGATALPGGIALLLAFRRRPVARAWILVGLAGAVLGVVTSQSRSAVITAIIAVLAMLALMAVGRQARRSMIALALLVAVAGGAVMAVDSYDSGTFYRYRTITPNRASSTLVESRSGTWASIPTYMHDMPFGAGIGTVGPAAGIWDDRHEELNAESQFTFLVVEAGVPGLVLFLAFQAALCAAIVSGLRRERDPRVVVLLAGIAAPLFGYAVNWLVGVNTVSTPNAPYLWLAAGIVSFWLVARQRAARSPAPDA
jgi:O-antigen ligase